MPVINWSQPPSLSLTVIVWAGSGIEDEEDAPASTEPHGAQGIWPGYYSRPDPRFPPILNWPPR